MRESLDGERKRNEKKLLNDPREEAEEWTGHEREEGEDSWRSNV